jgi:hypothetical protein
MQFNDFAKIPFTKININLPWMLIWLLPTMTTLIPGTLLWAITLGGFRYWHLLNMFLNWTVDKKLEEDGYGI